jgi:hypothetical protein
MGPKRDAGLSVNKFGTEPSVNAVRKFIARILVLFGEDGSGRV